MTKRTRILITLAIYVPVMVLFTIAASLFLIGHGVGPIFGVSLGFVLASVAFIALTIPVRILIGLRAWRHRNEGGSN